MNILITGATGLLGRAVRAAFMQTDHTIYAASNKRSGEGLIQSDLCTKSAVQAMLETTTPDVIINCAAERHPDICQKQPAKTRKLNVDLPRWLSASTATLIHISTDYVFSGTNAPYSEEANPDPLNTYGQLKAESESAVGRSAIILRLPILFGPTQDLCESAVTIVAHNMRQAHDEPIRIDNVATRYPTYTPDIARQLVAMVEQIDDLTGVYHYSAEEPMTKYQMLVEMNHILRCSIRQAIPDTTPTLAPRPLDSHLICKRLKRAGIFVMPTPFKQAITEVLAGAL